MVYFITDIQYTFHITKIIVDDYQVSSIFTYRLFRKDGCYEKNKPILGICDSNSPSYRILKEYGFDTVGSDKETIKKNILSIVNDDKKYDYDLKKLNNNYYDKLLIG